MSSNEIYKKFRRMKILRPFYICILQILCFFSCGEKGGVKQPTPQQKNDPVSGEILALEKARLNAIAQFDSIKLKQLLAPDFEMTTAQGELLDVHKMLQMLQKRSQTLIPEQHYTKLTQVKLLNENNLAVARGIYVIERKETRGLLVLTLRYTDLYVKNSTNSWSLFCSHYSRISR